jgi:hypothetical protein
MQGPEIKSKYFQERIIKNTKFDDIDKICQTLLKKK